MPKNEDIGNRKWLGLLGQSTITWAGLNKLKFGLNHKPNRTKL